VEFEAETFQQGGKRRSTDILVRTFPLLSARPTDGEQSQHRMRHEGRLADGFLDPQTTMGGTNETAFHIRFGQRPPVLQTNPNYTTLVLFVRGLSTWLNSGCALSGPGSRDAVQHLTTRPFVADTQEDACHWFFPALGNPGT